MAVSVNQLLANTLGLADPLGRIADDGRVGFNGRVNINGRPIRFGYSFDGVDDCGVLANRAINPDGDIDIQWTTRSSVSGHFIYQSLKAPNAEREFSTFIRTNGQMVIVVGGATYDTVASGIDFRIPATYRLLVLSTELIITVNGVERLKVGYVRGVVREPAAPTVICAQNLSGVFGSFFSGPIYNIRINGVLWPIQDRNQTIQLPQPSGLGAELITPTVLENPAVKGSQWTYLGAGRWQYIGDGSLNELQFITSAAQPNSGFLEFEIESISGSLACSINSVGNDAQSIFNSIGVKRYFFTKKGSGGEPAIGNAVTFKRPFAGIVASCIIKSISLKPLGTCNPLTLVNTTSDRWQEVPQ